MAKSKKAMKAEKAAKVEKAAKAARAKESDAKRENQNQSFKQMLYVLLGLIVALVLALAWLRFSELRKAEKAARQAENQLLRLKEVALAVKTEAERIDKDRVEKVGQPSDLVLKIATQLGIGNNVDVRSGNPGRFRRSEIYNEIPVTIVFRELRGYDLKGIHTFLSELERANSKVQVISINFGERDDPTADGKVFWRPTEARLRVFVPRS